MSENQSDMRAAARFEPQACAARIFVIKTIRLANIKVPHPACQSWNYRAAFELATQQMPQRLQKSRIFSGSC
jgi:hypothetical protein